MQTASAVLGDVVSILSGDAPVHETREQLPIVTDVASSFYLHLAVADRPGVLAQIAQVLGDKDVSVKSVVQRGVGEDARLVMVVHECLESRFAAALEAIDAARRAARAAALDPGDRRGVRLSPAPLIERYRERLSLEPGDPVVTLNEGSTPLVEAPRLSERLGVRAYLKFEGANPTGSFKDRGMTVAVSRAKGRGAEAVICASTGNTAASAAAYAARAGMRGAVIVPEGKIAIGKLAQALMHGARVVALQGNFDDALRIVRDLADKHPIELVNSVNPHRIEGQKTAAFEVVEELGEVPGALAIPVGNAGNVTAYWRGFQEVGARSGARSSTASRPRARRRSCTASRSPTPRPSPRRSGSATRPAGRRRWRPSPPRAAASPRSPTSRSSTPTAGSPPARASSASPPRPPRSPACSPTACPWSRAPPARVGRLRAHRPRPQGPRHGSLQSAAGDQLRERPQRGRARRLRVTARHRLVRVPASSANLGPGYDVLAAAVSLFLELEVEETGEFSLRPRRSRRLHRARQPDRPRFRDAASRRRHRLSPEKRDPPGARPRLQRRRDRRRPLRRRSPLRAGPLQGGDAGQGD